MRIGVTLRIVAGRGAARACVQLSALALLPVWGVDEFGRYAAAVGAFSWLILLVMGAEKVALTVLPRTRVLAVRYTRMLVARAATPLAITLVTAAALAPVGGTPALAGAAAAFAAGQGLLSMLAAVHRQGDRPTRDTAAFAGLAAWVIAASALAVAGVLRPHGYLLTLVAGVLADCAVLAALLPALRHRPSRTRRGARLGAMVNRRIVLLGLSDVADAAAGSVLYIVLAATAPPAASAALFVALTVSTVGGGLTVLLLRIRQPATSLRLRGTGGSSGRRRARVITGWAAAGTTGMLTLALAALIPVLALSGAGTAAAIGSSPPAIAAAVALEMTVFCAVTYAVFLVENTNGAVLATTSLAAVTGLAATALAGLVAAPALHTLGALLALNAGLAAKAGLLHSRLRRSDESHVDVRGRAAVAADVPARGAIGVSRRAPLPGTLGARRADRSHAGARPHGHARRRDPRR